MFPSSRVPRVRTDLVVEVLGDEVVVLDPVTGDLHHLDPRATLVWDLVDGHRTAQQIVEHLAEVVDAERAVVETDVRAVLSHLDSIGLLLVDRTARDRADRRT